MTRSADSSAPSDPFSAEAIVRCVQEAGRYTASELHERGKYLRVLGVLPMASATPSSESTSIKRNQPSESTTRVIESKAAASSGAAHCGTIVQQRETTDMDRKIITAIRGLGGFASAKAIHARVRGASLFVVRSRLDKLAGDGRVLSVPGRGYELRERA